MAGNPLHRIAYKFQSKAKSKNIFYALKSSLYEIYFHVYCFISYKQHNRKGLDFLREESVDVTKSASNYAGIFVPDLRKVLKLLAIAKNDSIIDFGCGKGLALRTFAEFPFNKIAGVELSDYVYKVACHNMRILKLHQVELHHIDAGAYSDIDDFNYIFFYNPFPSEVMKKVMSNIVTSIRSRKRDITIIYFRPLFESDILATGLFLKTAYNILTRDDVCLYKTRQGGDVNEN